MEVKLLKLAICAQGEGFQGQVDQRFGRCSYFVMVDTEKEEVIESVKNTNANAAGVPVPRAPS